MWLIINPFHNWVRGLTKCKGAMAICELFYIDKTKVNICKFNVTTSNLMEEPIVLKGQSFEGCNIRISRKYSNVVQTCLLDHPISNIEGRPPLMHARILMNENTFPTH
jgi:hypothetical protein